MAKGTGRNVAVTRPAEASSDPLLDSQGNLAGDAGLTDDLAGGTGGGERGVAVQTDSSPPANRQPTFVVDDIREAIAANHRENRHRQIDPQGEAHEDDEALPFEPAPLVARAPAADPRAVQQRQPQQPPVAAPAAQPDPLINLKVDGQVYQVPLSQVVAKAQQNFAADARLAEANQQLDRARQVAAAHSALATAPDNRAAQRAPEAAPAGGGAPAAPNQQTTLAMAKDLVKIVDHIQTGTAEEGAYVLAEFLNKVIPNLVMGVMAQWTAAAASQREQQAALDVIVNEFPEFIHDNDAAQLVISRTSHEMLVDLHRFGVPAAELQSIAGQPGFIKQIHDNARRQHPRNFRSYDALARDAATYVKANYGDSIARTAAAEGRQPVAAVAPGQPAARTAKPGGVTIQRVQRDKTQLNSQPQPTVARRDPAAPQGDDQAPRRRSPAEIVQEEMAARGQLVLKAA